jgi:hypothetical protein
MNTLEFSSRSDVINYMWVNLSGLIPTIDKVQATRVADVLIQHAHDAGFRYGQDWSNIWSEYSDTEIIDIATEPE